MLTQALWFGDRTDAYDAALHHLGEKNDGLPYCNAVNRYWPAGCFLTNGVRDCFRVGGPRSYSSLARHLRVGADSIIRLGGNAVDRNDSQFRFFWGGIDMAKTNASCPAMMGSPTDSQSY
ncbi:hypothetical protein IF1G_07463 [Cordyceps javanica]|uniref:Uncharacterized protein n=1 Tax=Cordyceps javanica TaxID=43265 RepID=A0A545UWA8_9HYPO|nr:hypothetical protein IF1G_07463 [Cordyceps javanica]